MCSSYLQFLRVDNPIGNSIIASAVAMQAISALGMFIAKTEKNVLPSSIVIALNGIVDFFIVVSF